MKIPGSIPGFAFPFHTHAPSAATSHSQHAPSARGCRWSSGFVRVTKDTCHLKWQTQVRIPSDPDIRYVLRQGGVRTPGQVGCSTSPHPHTHLIDKLLYALLQVQSQLQPVLLMTSHGDTPHVITASPQTTVTRHFTLLPGRSLTSDLSQHV